VHGTQTLLLIMGYTSVCLVGYGCCNCTLRGVLFFGGGGKRNMWRTVCRVRWRDAGWIVVLGVDFVAFVSRLVVVVGWMGGRWEDERVGQKGREGKGGRE
jgi:hypothetical protein